MQRTELLKCSSRFFEYGLAKLDTYLLGITLAPTAVNAIQKGDVEYLHTNTVNFGIYNVHAMCLASQHGHINVVKYFVGLGTDITWGMVERGKSQIGGRYYAFRIACSKGYLDLVRYFIDLGADITVYGDYPIIWACLGGHLRVVKYLVSKGANITAQGNAPIQYAANGNHLELVRYLHRSGACLSFFKKNFIERYNKYVYFCEKMEIINRIRAQKKIYYWWIPICYDTLRECGKRMMQRNWEKTQAGILC